MKKYPLFRKENIPAYINVMIVWLMVSAVSAVIIASLIDVLTFLIALIITLITTMCGMGIMFGASVFNLRKLGPGYRPNTSEPTTNRNKELESY